MDHNVDRYDVPVIRIQPDVNDDCVGDVVGLMLMIEDSAMSQRKIEYLFNSRRGLQPSSTRGLKLSDVVS